MEQERFLARLAERPDDAELRLVYADWLEQRGEVDASALLRVQLALSGLWPDHPHWHRAEVEISERRAALEPDWIARVAPELDAPPPDGTRSLRSRTVTLHRTLQDTRCDAWRRLCDRIEEARQTGITSFGPLRELADREQIVTLPASIGQLHDVEELILYSSSLVRIPPEIGGMRALRKFVPYTSYALHWFPYTITRCGALQDSSVSTRALYGNFKNRPPFPSLQPAPIPERIGAVIEALWGPPVRDCDACGASFEDRGQHRLWISLWVGTDTLPLLANLCSDACAQRLPAPPEGYVPHPHRGGPGLQQPQERLRYGPARSRGRRGDRGPEEPPAGRSDQG